MMCFRHQWVTTLCCKEMGMHIAFYSGKPYGNQEMADFQDIHGI